MYRDLLIGHSNRLQDCQINPVRTHICKKGRTWVGPKIHYVMISKSQLTREPVSFLEEEEHVPGSQF